MKKLLNITLLIIAVLLGSCKEESSVSRIEKGTTKKVKALSYTFNSTQNEDSGTVKSGNSTDSTKVVSPIERKVISVETWEAGGEMFVASLIEENDPIETKAPTQKVDGSSVYTFYAYKNSEIKIQPPITADNKTIEVPVDDATNYGIIFLSSAEGMNNPKEVTPTTIDNTKKELTYKAKFNENVCYASFDKGTMPIGNPIDVTFKPVFSQLGISVPSKVKETTINVDKVSLVSGAQENTTVKVTYNSAPTKNIRVSYDSVTTDYKVDLSHSLNATNDTTFLSSGGQLGYYNIIPNGNDAQLSIKMTISGTTASIERTIAFKDDKSNPIPFKCGKRYTIKLENVVPVLIELSKDTLIIDEEDIDPHVLTATVTMSDDSKITPTSGSTWSFSTSGIVNQGSTTASSISLTKLKRGATTVTISYGGKTASAKVYVAKRYTIKDYYQWDAYLPYDPSNPNGTTPPWGPGSSSYHKGAGVTPETQKFKEAAVHIEILSYRGDRVYSDSGDSGEYGLDDISGELNIQPYILPDNKLYTRGDWYKKWIYLSGDTVGVPKKIKGRPSNSDISQYYFVPMAGLYYNGNFRNGGITGLYWTGDLAFKNSADSTNSCYLGSGVPGSLDYGYKRQFRKNGCIPYVGFDDTYKIPISISVTSGTVIKGETITLKAVGIYEGGKELDLSPSAIWKSESPNIATVSGYSEKVRGVEVGVANITATVHGLTGTGRVKVIKVDDIIISPNPLNIEPGKTGDLTVTKVKMSDGSERTPTKGFTWEINPDGVVTSTSGGVVSPSPRVVDGNSTTNIISLTAKQQYYGSAKVTVTYGGVSKTVDVNVYRDIPATRYYMWDAPVDQPYPTTNGGAKPNYNTTNDAASRSCKDAPTVEDIKKYLGAEVYWVEDGPPYKLPNNEVSRTGLMVMKWDKLGSVTPKENVTPKNDFLQQETTKQIKYFFLPACGAYKSGSFYLAGTYGNYWSSTPNATYTDDAYFLSFFSGNASVYYNYGYYSYRNYGFVPMVGFDDSYVPATVEDIIISPNPLNIAPGQTGTLTVTKVKMSDGSERTPTTGFTWEINPDGVVTSTSGGVVSPSPRVVDGNSTTNIISLTAKQQYYGSAKVTVTYGGVSKTVDVNVYRDIPATRYYMWDAPVDQPYPTTNGGAKPNYNTTNDAASRSCKDAPTREDIMKYLGAEVYWVEDGPPFKLPDGGVYRKGLLVMKWDKIGSVTPEEIVTPKNDFSKQGTTKQIKYCFLPACGYYLSGIFNVAGINGYYWSSTPDATGTSFAYSLNFTSGTAYVSTNYADYSIRSSGFERMPRL